MAVTRVIERLLEHPWVYAAWQAPFAAEKFAPLARHLRQVEVRRVLDVGCGPGTNARQFGNAEYVGLDINERYLASARRKYRGRFVQADLAIADLPSLGRFDTIVLNSLLHHLPDEAVHRLLGRLEPLLDDNGRIHVLDLVMPERPSVAMLTARLDRGRYARREDVWRNLLAGYFEPVVIEPYRFGGGLWAMLYFQGKARCVSR